MPKFNRISLVGSEELFRPTRVEHDDDSPVEEAPADVLAGHERHPVAPNPVYPTPAPAPLSREQAAYRLQLTEGQLKILLEAVQRMKYPAQIHGTSKPSVEEFEALEELRNTLFDVLG
jgi:hypothetical protein